MAKRCCPGPANVGHTLSVYRSLETGRQPPRTLGVLNVVGAPSANFALPWKTFGSPTGKSLRSSCTGASQRRNAAAPLLHLSPLAQDEDQLLFITFQTAFVRASLSGDTPGRTSDSLRKDPQRNDAYVQTLGRMRDGSQN